MKLTGVIPFLSKKVGAFLATLLLVGFHASPAEAGSGRFSSGTFDFCVSVRFNATDAQLTQIRTGFQNASQILSDATDGQHKFGNVTLVNNSGAGATAEYWINSGGGRAYATEGKYGVRGEHVMLYFNDNFRASPSADGDAYTIAHEHAHHAYGVLDEYSGPSGNAECAAPPDTAGLSFCLMDNYFTRGGNMGTGGTGTYTLNEFCVSSNHDPDTDTFQHNKHSKSCWEVIGAHAKRSATAPAGLPTGAAPAAHTVNFANGAGGLRVMLVIDRSGSMAGDRIAFARSAASIFTSFLRVGDSVGVASFASGASVDFPLTRITGQDVKSGARAAIAGLVASGSTNIGGGLQAGLSQITGQSDRSCNEIIVLLTDGDHNTGTHPSAVLPALRTSGVTVFATAVGTGISSGGLALLQTIGSQTGGKFLQVASSFGLVSLFYELLVESTGSGLLVRAPQVIGANQVRETSLTLESNVLRANFGVAVADSRDEITVSLRSPTGRLITPADAGVDPRIGFINEPNLRALSVDQPEAGTWTIIVTSMAVTTGTIEVLADAEHEGLQLNVSLDQENLTFPDAAILQATPQFDGERVVGALVNGRVIRPNGSVANFPLFDDGLAAHGDSIAGDGIYGARFDRYAGDGVYRFEITAVNVDGDTFAGEDLQIGIVSNTRPVPAFTRTASVSAIVAGVPPVPAPAAPTDLRVAGTTANSITLAWMDNSADEDGFEIQRDSGGGFLPIAQVGPNVTTFTDPGLTTGSTHRYRVRAVNGGGESDFTNTVEAITLPNPPEAPVQLTAQPLSRTSVRLNWTDRSNNETGFKIQRRGPGADFTDIGTVGENITTFTDTTATPDTQYTYQVIATNAGGDSSASNQIGVLIRTGGLLVVAPGTLDFGEVRVRETGVGEVILENDSADPIRVNIQLPVRPFAVPRYQQFVIPPFGMRAVEVHCSPRMPAGYRNRILFRTNSRNTPRVEVILLGKGVR